MSAATASQLELRRPTSWRRAGVDAIVVGAAVAFTASYFPLSLLLSPTVVNGGDMSSHYYPALYLREVLLPRGQLMGWVPGNYAGYPMFQFYFPAPFVLMAALSLAVPMAVAFKLVTVLGVVLLPICSWASLRLMRVPFPGPALGALGSLCFLFMEANSMWGGNIPSMLAGEFTFSLGFALSTLFVGTLRRAIETGRGWAGNAALVALIGLCHGYPLLWAGLVSTLELLTTRGWWRRFGTLVGVHGVAILLMAFWLVPMLGYAPWTTAFNVTWLHSSWQEVLPPILWPAALLAGGSALVLGGLCIWKREPFPRSVATWWGAIAISLFFYATAYSFHVVDVRFLPFLQLGLCLAAAAGLGQLLARLHAPEVWPVAACLATLPFVQTQVRFIPEWIRWNYSGFEEKAGWPILSELSRRLSGDFRDPRVVYEHSLDHEVLGTVRAFENLPLFSGRSTLEGLYMQSSVTTPFVFYLQSEISKEISCPLPNWGCTRLHLDRGVEHLRMFNVSQFIVRSDEVKQAARRHPGLSREAEVGAYEIYAVRDNAGRYAVPLESAPVLVRARDWKVAAYQWFKRSGPRDPVAVFAEDVSAEEARAFAGDFSDLPSELPRSPLGAPPQLGERVETDRIALTGCRPGHPVLVRMSYHPRWRATTGERIFLAAPSFMLVIPRGERVELAFEAGPVLGAGRVLTALGGFLALVGVVPAARRRVSSRVHALAESGALAPLLVPVRRSAAWSEPTRRWLLAGALGVTLLTLGGFVGATLRSNAEDFYREGVELFSDDRLRDSLPFFRETQRLAPLSASAYHARYFEAMVYFREEQWPEAEERFRTIVESFPEAPNAPEALYHLGLARARLGKHAEAAEAWRETVRRFPEVQWAVHARARLAEVGLEP